MPDHRTDPSTENTRSQIEALIDRMPEKMQLKLLRFLKAKLPKRITDDPVLDNRTGSRRLCLIGVDYRIDGKPFYGFMLDISAFGVFIESDTPRDALFFRRPAVNRARGVTAFRRVP
jgi:hypothetical protein